MIVLLIKQDDIVKTTKDVLDLFTGLNIISTELVAKSFNVILDTDKSIQELTETVDANILAISEL